MQKPCRFSDEAGVDLLLYGLMPMCGIYALGLVDLANGSNPLDIPNLAQLLHPFAFILSMCLGGWIVMRLLEHYFPELRE